MGNDQHLPACRPSPPVCCSAIPSPVAKHLEEGVVVVVLAHIIKVIVLAAGADALEVLKERRAAAWALALAGH